MGIHFLSTIGTVCTALPALPCLASGHVSLNTPVGNCIDHFGHIWLADTAHNRLLIFDKEMMHLLAVFGSTGDGEQQFNMPFRLLPHPERNWIYVSDIGNTRVHILEYDQALSITSVKRFGNEQDVALKGPNGLTFWRGELCVADEFYEGPGGASRLVIFSEDGEYRRSLHAVETENGPIHFLWPQGLSRDEQGYLYIANTGFATVVRCDWQGKGVPFQANGKCYLDGLALARDVSVTQNRILIPGAKNNAISVYDMAGHAQGELEGFFSPIQVTAVPDTHKMLITEPILATLQMHEIDLSRVGDGDAASTRVLASVGDERDNPGQFHFITAVAGALDAAVKAVVPSPFVALFERWFAHQLSLQETWLKALQPAAMPAWWNLAVTTQLEWVQRWQQTWLRVMLNDKFDDPKDVLWMVDAGNFQLQASENGKQESSMPISLPLMPGSLGIAAYKPQQPLPGQLDFDVPMIVVGNYLSGIVTIFQYDNRLGELVPYTNFGGMGSAPWQLNKPQGLAIDPVSNDIFIADSGNNRIARWRLSPSGVAGLVEVFGELGQANGQFHTPTDITVCEQGRLYVTDQNNNRVQIFDNGMKWVHSFGQPGYSIDSDHFLLPTSIDYDNQHLFVSDLVNRAIKVFDLNGNIVDSFSSFGADASKGQLWMPYLLHANNNHIYLPDCALNRINVYRFDHHEQEGTR
ncbi:NHL repeat-containing protein [Photobacterium galatheae]|uniref:SMP-30/Gluconolactonase/LRE-like region domain-containing protein n=1 Tax=Photobacterium galatheae TaxID=1654360 RepID=A0A066RL52_9GAMM|nr:NHL repeat-containing protein [Photobacterium galatheae]KDM89841.1 hypothetical protein EA58_20535 [Photobacterium galatheae]MCM0151137.1 hypothetical protein [Photobacterium galatheae]